MDPQDCKLDLIKSFKHKNILMIKLTMNKYLIQKFFDLKSIKFGDFKLKSGINSPFYINLRNLISEPLVLKKLAKVVYEQKIKEIHLDCIEKDETLSICGLPYAGIPLASYISCLYNIPLLILRKEKKDYGTKQMIEGITENTNKVILIDDIITTGLSIEESLFHFENLEIVKIIVVIDREQKKIIDVNYDHIFKIKEIFHFLKLGQHISKKDFEDCIYFLNN